MSILNLILKRIAGEEFLPENFYRAMLTCKGFFTFDPPFCISKSMSDETEENVKKELCNFIANQGYDQSLCDYINSVNWLSVSDNNN